MTLDALAEKVFATIPLGNVAGREHIRAALAQAERMGMERAAKMADAYCQGDLSYFIRKSMDAAVSGGGEPGATSGNTATHSGDPATTHSQECPRHERKPQPSAIRAEMEKIK